MRSSTLVLAVALAVVPAASARAQATQRPDYSGRWTLNVARSDFGPQGGAPAGGTLVVRHAGTSLQTINAIAGGPMGEQTDSLTYVIGGPAVAHEVRNVGPASSAAAWDGNVLSVRTTLQTHGMEIPIASRWVLAPDGKMLTVERNITTPMGAMNIRMVYDRQ